MADTLNDLYLKYVEEVGKSLEDDRYFRYLLEMIMASDNTLSQQHQVLHKVVDERWLGTIEDSLDSLNKIVEKPRRSIERHEEVVPVSLAKKITADSVMHLSMNTQFIACADEDNVQPTHILNVSVDETYDLYENRFVYHLIQRLVTFVDKRTDIIFWSTGDETQNTLTMESKIDDAYEQIEYKLEMKIKNLQSMSENDADNMDVFMRIDRVRRLVMALKNSSFCQIMAGCQKVRSPIQRTNLLTKDPDYRKCYQLWQFLESYDEVGYSIDVQNTALEFDEEYQIQMYTNLIGNYAVFKSITEGDKREIEGAESKRHRVIKPRFVKEIQEEIVTDYDIPEVEVRQVLIEEVTQAQLDAEAKLEEEIKAREEVEKALREAEASAHHSMIQAEYANSAKFEAEQLTKEAEEKLKVLEQKLEDARAEKDEISLIIQEKDEIIAAKDEQISAEVKDYVRELEEQRKIYEDQINEMSTNHEMEIRDMRAEFEEQNENIELKYVDQMDKQEEETTQEIEAIQIRSEENIAKTIEEFEQKIAEQAEEHKVQLAEKTNMYQGVLDRQQQVFSESLEAQRNQLTEEMKNLTDAHNKQIADSEVAHDAAITELKESAKAELTKQKAESEKVLSEELEAGRKKYDKLQEESRKAYDTLLKEKEKELTDTKAEAHRQLLEEKNSAEKKLIDVTNELKNKYEDLKHKDSLELAQAKQTAREELNSTKEAANKLEAELRAEIIRLSKQNELLENERKNIETQLNEEISTRRSIETELSTEKDLRTAAEQKVSASTVSEFRQALRIEKKARKNK